MTEFVSGRLTSVYMYLPACTVRFACTHMDVYMYNVHIHSLHAGAQWVSRSLCPAGCTCIYMHVLFVHTHMDVCMYNVHIHSLHAGAQWLSRSDRVCVLQVDGCIPV